MFTLFIKKVVNLYMYTPYTITIKPILYNNPGKWPRPPSESVGYGS